ncbi:MAG: class I SAM-dependent methyltransferase [Pseudomonadota bacterium]
MAKPMLEKIYALGPNAKGKEIQDFYNVWAESYEEEVQVQNHYAMPQRAAAICEYVEERDCSIIDIGCGTGLSGQALYNQGFHDLHGCDFSTQMLAKARARGIYKSLQQIDLMTLPIPIADDAYAISMAIGVFASAHLGETAGAEMLRITKPGGIMCMTQNDVFAETGILQAMIARFEAGGLAICHKAEHGEHLPGHNVKGWVYILQRTQRDG